MYYALDVLRCKDIEDWFPEVKMLIAQRGKPRNS